MKHEEKRRSDKSRGKRPSAMKMHVFFRFVIKKLLFANDWSTDSDILKGKDFLYVLAKHSTCPKTDIAHSIVFRLKQLTRYFYRSQN